MLGGGVGSGGGGVGGGVGSGGGGGVGCGCGCGSGCGVGEGVVGLIIHKPSRPFFVAYTSQSWWVGDDKRTAVPLVEFANGSSNGDCRAGAGVCAGDRSASNSNRDSERKRVLVGQVVIFFTHDSFCGLWVLGF